MPNKVELTPKSKALLKKLAKSGDIDLRPSFKVIGIGYRKEVNQTFEKKQPRIASLRWKELNPKYAKQKERQYPGAPLLVRSGSLLASMIAQGATGNITLIGNRQAVFGSSLSYGVFHDEGRGNNPKRNFSEPSERRERIWIEQIERDISRQFERKGIDVDRGVI